MTYVDGFVLAVPAAKQEAYLRIAREAAVVFKEYGALSVVECWEDDVPDGEVTSFKLAVKCEPDEKVVFSWITWPSREARDIGQKQAMADPRFEQSMHDMPFDGKRMFWGGFQTILDE